MFLFYSGISWKSSKFLIPWNLLNFETIKILDLIGIFNKEFILEPFIKKAYSYYSPKLWLTSSKTSSKVCYNMTGQGPPIRTFWFKFILCKAWLLQTCSGTNLISLSFISMYVNLRSGSKISCPSGIINKYLCSYFLFTIFSGF